MIDLEPLIRTELERLLPLPDASRADWNDVRRRAALDGRSAAARRVRLVTAGGIAALLIAVGTATGLGIDFFAALDEVDRRPWTPPDVRRVGPRAEIARGEDWAVAAWKSAGGLCVAHAAGAAARWSVACGPHPDRGDDKTSDYLITLLVVPHSGQPLDEGDAKDGLGTIVGAVTAEVARVELTLADGRMLRADAARAPAALDTPARLFVVRTLLERPQLGTTSPVRALAAYGRDGRRLERFPLGLGRDGAGARRARR